MQPDRSRIIYLLGRYADNSCSREEFEECQQYLGEARHNPVVMEWMEEQWLLLTGVEWEQKDYNHLFPDIKNMPGARKTILWLRLSAAAAILILFSAGIYFLSLHHPEPGEGSTGRLTIQPVKNDIAPGSNKAILTLANGKQIILDSAHKGTIALQGNANIIKTDSGSLTYSPEPGEGPSATVYNMLTTPRGGQYQLTLPDGSQVWLNAASSIRYPTAFTGKERRVEITGEAYFEVVHNSRMPFRVKAGNELVEDLGTSFNVNAYSDEPAQTTTLVAGSVKIGNLILKPGEQAAFNTEGKTDLISNANIEDILAWKNGRFRFSSVSIETIMRQAARWYDMQVEYKGKINETFQRWYFTERKCIPAPSHPGNNKEGEF